MGLERSGDASLVLWGFGLVQTGGADREQSCEAFYRERRL